MNRRALAAALLVAALPQLALAEPAVVRLFEAPARAAPAPDAEVLQVLAERAEVSVSEEATDGWRRVRLEDGRIGWIEERALSFPAATAPAPVPTAGATRVPTSVTAPAGPAPDLRARIYVKDLGHLSDLVNEDPTVAPMAKRLADRRAASRGVATVGGLVSITLMVVGASKFGDDHADPGDPDFMKPDASQKLFVGGVLSGIASLGVALAIHPRRGELLDVVNAWNTRHPDQPFEIYGGHRGGHLSH